MSTDLGYIAQKAGIFLLCALFLALMTGVIWLDIRWLGDGVSETSLTETTQEFILLFISLFWFRIARRVPQVRGQSVLIGGFFACMLIRELDFLFDMLHHGSWVWFALLCATVCIILSIRHPAQTIHGLAEFLRHPSWGMMMAGLLTVLVFSRLYGVGAIWQQLMTDSYDRTVKNMAEEGCELLGYSLCLMSTMMWWCREKNALSPAQ